MKPAPNQGWTLIEIAAVTVIVGILAAMSFPSMVGMQARNGLNNSLSQVKEAIQEAQRSAIKSGRICPVVINTDLTVSVLPSQMKYHVSSTSVDAFPSSPLLPNPINSANANDPNNYVCITSPVLLPDNINLDARTTITRINFSYKGTTTNGGTIVLSANGTSDKKCLTISNGLGIFRTGNYYDSTTSPTASPARCESAF